MMSSSGTFCIRTNDFRETVGRAVQELREDTDFSDVTLACADNHQVEAHKAILAASSPFFRDVLTQSRHPRPFIYLRGVGAGELRALLDFIYRGQAEVPQEDLETFLATAAELGLKGLEGATRDGSGMLDEITEQSEEISKASITEAQIGSAQIKVESQQKESVEETVQDFAKIKVDILSMMEKLEERIGKDGQFFCWRCKTCDKRGRKDNIRVHIKSIHIKGGSRPSQPLGQDFLKLEEGISSMMEKIEDNTGKDGQLTRWRCTACGKHGRRDNLRVHIEGAHMERGSHACQVCESVCATRHSLKTHMRRHSLGPSLTVTV
jgi:hypothetical protein